MQKNIENLKIKLKNFLSFLEEHRRAVLVIIFCLISLLVILPFVYSYISFDKEFGLRKKGPQANTLSGNETLEQVQEIIEPERIVFEKIPEESFLPPPTGKMIRVNLYTMMLKRYENGTLLDSKKILSKGVKGSLWEVPSGLSKNNRASAHDLFRLAQYITNEKPFIWDITKRRSYSAQGHTAKNISQFLSDKDLIGAKSGFTYEAKQSNVGVWELSLSEISKRKVAIIVLRSNDRYRDTQNILSYLKKQVVYGRDGKFIVTGPKDKSKELTIRLTGDIMLDRGVEYSVNKNFGGDFRQLFTNLSSYKDADIFFANLEGPVSDVGKDSRNLYSFRMDPKVLPMMADVGLDIVSFANNHVGDWGLDAFSDTLVELTNTNIAYTGAGDTVQKAQEPTIIERKGLKVGFLGFSDIGPAWLYNDQTPGYGINRLDTKNFDQLVKNASTKVDILIVSVHWGTEYSKTTERQREFAHRAIDNGAKIVAGHHPHVIQSVEVYKGGLIAYSLGNFIFDQAFSKETMRGLTLEVTLDTDERYIKRYDTYITEQDQYFIPSAPFKEKVLEE